jgi:transposase
MLTIGLDVHQRLSALCILGPGGELVKEMVVRGGWDLLVAELSRIQEPFQVCYEASCGYGALHDRLARFAARVVVAHPGHLRLIFRAKKKTDRVDARKLATLLLLDQVPPVHVPDPQTRAWRELIEHRRGLIDKRTRAKNGLRALLRSHGLRPLKAGQWLWSHGGREWARGLELPGAAALRRDLLLAELEHFNAQEAHLTRGLNTQADRSAAVQLLQTIPGVGPRVAETICAYIDRPERFAHARQAGAYFGLVPRQDQSAGMRRSGRITKDGPATARKMLVEAAWQGIRRSPTLRAIFDRVSGGTKDRRRIALIAVANHLARVMLAMLKSGTPWEERIAAPAA